MDFMLIGVLVVMVGLMFFSSRQNRKRQQDSRDFRTNLSAGDQVMTGSGLIGEIDSINLEQNYVIIKSESSKSRWLIDAITKVPENVQNGSKDVVEADEAKMISKLKAKSNDITTDEEETVDKSE